MPRRRGCAVAGNHPVTVHLVSHFVLMRSPFFAALLRNIPATTTASRLLDAAQMPSFNKN
jgi:hypothetical protein